jgi:cleavage and polyadenylation specificity factor subunit 3
MDEVTITPLGAGCEVGRSCIILECGGKKIMLDCGLHMSKQGEDSKPYFDRVNPAEISLILITHSHLDHCGALPIFLANTSFQGRVLMTRPTKQIYQYLLQDSIKVRSENIKLFGSEEIKRSVAKIETIDFDQEIEHEGIRVTPYCAGHVLGAAMFLVKIGDISVLYTGDYSC